MSNHPQEDDAEAAMDRAKPAINSVLRRYLGRRVLDHDEAEEIASEEGAPPLTRLGQAGGARIHAIESYAAGLTFNLVKDLFRKRLRGREEALLPEHESIADARPPVQLGVEQRRDLKRIWRTIEGLSPQHRAALLLSMRSSGGAHGIGLLILLDVVSTHDLAKAIGVSAPDHEDSLWDELPLDDIRIAARLDVTARQVSHFRKAARKSLTASYRR